MQGVVHVLYFCAGYHSANELRGEEFGGELREKGHEVIEVIQYEERLVIPDALIVKLRENIRDIPSQDILAQNLYLIFLIPQVHQQIEDGRFVIDIL